MSTQIALQREMRRLVALHDVEICLVRLDQTRPDLVLTRETVRGTIPVLRHQPSVTADFRRR